MALWPIAETLGFAMEQTLNKWKHSASTLDVFKVKKAVTPIVPTDNLVLIFFFFEGKKKKVYDLLLEKYTSLGLL